MTNEPFLQCIIVVRPGLFVTGLSSTKENFRLRVRFRFRPGTQMPISRFLHSFNCLKYYNVLSFPQGTVAGVVSRGNLRILGGTDQLPISVFVDVACYAKWIQDQCQKLDKQTKCTFNADPKPKEDICPDPNTNRTLDPNPGTRGTASHLKSSAITSLAYALFIIAKILTSSFH